MAAGLLLARTLGMASDPDADLSQRLIEVLPLPVVGVDAQLNVAIWNAASEREFGWKAEEVIGRPNPTVPVHLRSEWENILHRVFEGEVVRHHPSYRVRRDGSRLDILVSNAVAHDETGTPTASIGIYFPLSDIHEREQQAQKARQRMQALLDSIADLSMLTFDLEGSVRQLNPAAERTFGRAELTFTTLYADPAEAVADLRLAHEHGHVRREARLVRADGTFFWADFLVAVVQVGDASELMVLTRDAEPRRVRDREIADREAELRLMLDQLPALVWTTDGDLTLTALRGKVPSDNKGAGLRVGRNVREFVEPESDFVIQAMLDVLKGAPSAQYTYDYAGHTYDVRIEPLRDENGSVRGTVAVAFDVTERHEAREEVRRLAAQVNTMEEDQRRRIAREIHDELGQRLTALSLELSMLRRETAGAASARFDAMGALIHETVDTVRRVASELRPPLLDDFGFNAAVEMEVSELQRRSGIDATLRLTDRDPQLDEGATTALYRIVQEALTNVVRHANAAHVSVSVTQSPAGVELEVSDDGRGITPDRAGGKGSLGLVGVRERAWAYGGDVRIEGKPGGGTRIAVRLPLVRQ